MALKAIMMTAAASALITGSAIAQEVPTTGTDAPMTTEMPTEAPAMEPTFISIGEMTVGDMVGQNVYEVDGDIIGDIDYIVGSDGDARAVIGIGGILGLGEYTVALPLEGFTYDANQQMVKVSTTKDTLKEQPEFDETDAESLPDETRLSDLLANPGASAPAVTSGDATSGTSN
jgi:hypothetical protein